MQDDATDEFDRFLQSYWRHRNEGQVEPLSFYLAKFPSVSQQVEREYVELSGPDAAKASDHRIGPFRVIAELGRGGQGVVYRAEDTRLQRVVALKVMPLGDHISAERLARFEREARLASRLDHPAICPVFEAGQFGEQAFIAMRLVEGQSLADYLQRAALRQSGPELRLASEFAEDGVIGRVLSSGFHDRLSGILQVCESIARGLHAAHEAGVVHRDLKPANVMIESSGQPVILDFGLSKDASEGAHSLTESGAVFGTPSYMSPEQVAGEQSAVSARTDVYALAALLFECLTLKRPFEKATQSETLIAIRNEAPPRIRRVSSSFPKDLETVIETAMAKAPASRFATAEELAEELARIRLREPIRTRAIRSWTRTWRWAQRHPRLAAALSGVFLSLVAGLSVAIVLLLEVDYERNEAAFVADLTYLRELKETAANELLAVDPRRLPQFELWLEEARRLRSRRKDFEHAIARASEPFGGDELAVWRTRTKSDFLRELDAFEDRDSSDLYSFYRVLERRSLSEVVVEYSVSGKSEVWARTVDRVSSNRVYEGLTFQPQVGLIPVGPDPASGLEEFAVFGTGSIPGRDRVGRLELDAESAVVMVLVPGGAGVLGVPEDDAASTDDNPLTTVALDPFFIGKFELTRAQWRRLMGWDRSYAVVTRDEKNEPSMIDPVNSITWAEAREFALVWRADLPTEAQWEYACRCGADSPDRVMVGNFADEGSTADFQPSWSHGPGDDGWSVSAPIGQFPPNGWGLHDMAGNVSEWCRDGFESYEVTPLDGTGLRSPDLQGGIRVARGGSFDLVAQHPIWAYRSGDYPVIPYWGRGVRIVRSLNP